ncbi:MAG: hypothetical protein EOM62_21840 [Bacteroidia bacterium]|nr:hypothetical protein [Bacteroidia bacterium]
MTKLISGIDLAKLAEWREPFDVKLAEDKTITVPLITLRDANRAETFLKRADTIAAQYALLASRLNERAVAAQAAKEELSENSDEGNKEQVLEALKIATDDIMQSQKDSDSLIVQSNQLADEILVFLQPYLEKFDVISVLKEKEAQTTIRLLSGMLYGAAVFEEQKEGAVEAAENPTPG